VVVFKLQLIFIKKQVKTKNKRVLGIFFSICKPFFFKEKILPFSGTQIHLAGQIPQNVILRSHTGDIIVVSIITLQGKL
jgi:hypothetical protein